MHPILVIQNFGGTAAVECIDLEFFRTTKIVRLNASVEPQNRLFAPKLSAVFAVFAKIGVIQNFPAPFGVQNWPANKVCSSVHAWTAVMPHVVKTEDFLACNWQCSPGIRFMMIDE